MKTNVCLRVTLQGEQAAPSKSLDIILQDLGRISQNLHFCTDVISFLVKSTFLQFTFLHYKMNYNVSFVKFAPDPPDKSSWRECSPLLMGLPENPPHEKKIPIQVPVCVVCPFRAKGPPRSNFFLPGILQSERKQAFHTKQQGDNCIGRGKS